MVVGIVVVAATNVLVPCCTSFDSLQAMSFNAEMIACGLPKTLRNMKTRQWADPDIKEDVDALDT